MRVEDLGFRMFGFRVSGGLGMKRKGSVCGDCVWFRVDRAERTHACTPTSKDPRPRKKKQNLEYLAPSANPSHFRFQYMYMNVKIIGNPPKNADYC